MGILSSQLVCGLSGRLALALVLGFQFAPGLSSAPELSPPCALYAALDAAQDWELAKEDTVGETVVALEELAAFCQKSKINLERDRAYETVLALAPDNTKARKALGWTWDRKQEEWKRRKPYRAPKNRKPDMLPEALELRSQILVHHRENILKLMSKGEGISPKLRRGEIALLLRFNPGDAVLRDLNGQVKEVNKAGEERWILKQTPRALATRREIKSRFSQLTSEIVLKGFEAEDWEQQLGVEWASRRASGRVKVYCTGSNSEADLVARKVHAVFDLLPSLVGGDTQAPEDFRVYLMSEEKQHASFLKAFPDIKAPDREAFMDLASGWLVWGRLGCWDVGEPQRMDSAVRQTVSFYLWRSHGIIPKQGWVEQGLGMYLTYKIAGTRLSFALATGEGSSANPPKWASSIHDDDVDFLELAQDMLESGGGPKVSLSLGRSVNSMTTKDLLFSYALAAYLIEGHSPEAVSEVLTRCGAGENPTLVLESVLDLDIQTIEALLLEWLKQMRG